MKFHFPAMHVWVAMVCVALLTCCGRAAGGEDHGIPNFAQVSPGIWRGGQPNAEGWQYLKSLGVKWDVKLNTDKEASDSAAKTNGIQVISIPITLKQQILGRPTAKMLGAAVDAIKSEGTYVHCEHGQDRTGLVIGAYRVRVQRWSKSEAYKEMKAHGFHPLLHGLYSSWLEDVVETPAAAKAADHL